MNTGKTIRNIRQQQHLSQKQLAQLVEISPSYLCDMEKGRYNGSVKVLERIATALKVDLATLLK